MVQVGQQVPDFIVPATRHKNVRLSALKGYNVLLYFYPKDQSPICTIESQDFSANYHCIRASKTLLFGVSRDSIESHEQFKQEQSLPFELISDVDSRLCQLFDVLKERLFHGKKVISLRRSTFLINGEGILVKEWREVNVQEHVHDVLQYLTNRTDNLTKMVP